MFKESLTFAGKDLKIEFRTKHMLNAMIIFALMIILSFRFSFSLITTGLDEVVDELAPAILWITFIFMGMYGLTASFAKEKDKETLSGLLLCPADRSAIYVGKVISNLMVVFLIEIVTIILFSVFFSYNYSGNFLLLILVIILGTIGFVIIGTLISAISINTKSREVLLPILLIPLVIFTVIMPSITATTTVLSGGNFAGITEEIRLLSTFNIIYFIIGIILFEFVIEE
jgi:heme exporter protein B